MQIFWAGTLINTAIIYLIWKRIWIQATKYIIVGSFLISTNNSFSGDTLSLALLILVFFYIVLISLYEDWVALLIVFAGSSLISNYYLLKSYDFSVPDVVAPDLILLDFFLLLVTGILMAQVQFNMKVRKQGMTLYNEVVAIKEKNEDNIRSIQDTVQTLKTFSQELVNNISNTSRISQEMTKAFADVAAGVETQASSIVEINESIHHTADFINEVKSSADQLSQLSASNFKVVTEGIHKLEDLESEIKEMSGITHSIVKTTNELSQRSIQIEGILKEVDEMAKQTNLLALNAAIEAARAGEHGRGFSIVAGEVRKLAENSRKSVESIADILGGIQMKTEDATHKATAGEQTVIKGERSLFALKEGFNNIVVNTENVVKESAGIEEKLAELTQSSGKISEESLSISTITEQHTATTQEILSSIEVQANMTKEIENKYSELDRIIGKLEHIAKQGT
ncbi:methyl-accepting chemotaxis protein [Paenibacillus sp. sgz302251]|uniref:methyl-accepting chemotaxis protein n=1 Tax=Paenibacillus sp. sgz302251 TaxID=3414493 RepID=UPI003C7C8121